eukprot:TRINITY_DN72519_c0_g1_i1.p1 TRINITY_DN72519_c0_g1~~TRINITY_DN72519_c0_g1_i1.p1  ORF type:complete len:248 (-),score=30.76 TRINITY_DN72519_c0_g1_i1:171-914(-)
MVRAGINYSGAACDETRLVSHAIRRALLTLDNTLRREGHGQPGILPTGQESGVKNLYGLMVSTAVTALIRCDGPPAQSSPLQVVIANLGDSRALLSRAGKAVALSKDHSPNVHSERVRIEQAGGFVANVGNVSRIDGWGLNLTRALGDFHYKNREDLPPEQQKVSCYADVFTIDITADDEFLFLGCDGVFELLNNQGVIDHVRAALQEGKSMPEVVESLVDACCSPSLAQTGCMGGDNVSATIVMLK